MRSSACWSHCRVGAPDGRRSAKCVSSPGRRSSTSVRRRGAQGLRPRCGTSIRHYNRAVVAAVADELTRARAMLSDTGADVLGDSRRRRRCVADGLDRGRRLRPDPAALPTGAAAPAGASGRVAGVDRPAYRRAGRQPAPVRRVAASACQGLVTTGSGSSRTGITAGGARNGPRPNDQGEPDESGSHAPPTAQDGCGGRGPCLWMGGVDQARCRRVTWVRVAARHRARRDPDPGEPLLRPLLRRV